MSPRSETTGDVTAVALDVTSEEIEDASLPDPTAFKADTVTVLSTPPTEAFAISVRGLEGMNPETLAVLVCPAATGTPSPPTSSVEANASACCSPDCESSPESATASSEITSSSADSVSTSLEELSAGPKATRPSVTVSFPEDETMKAVQPVNVP